MKAFWAPLFEYQNEEFFKTFGGINNLYPRINIKTVRFIHEQLFRPCLDERGQQDVVIISQTRVYKTHHVDVQTTVDQMVENSLLNVIPKIVSN